MITLNSTNKKFVIKRLFDPSLEYGLDLRDLYDQMSEHIDDDGFDQVEVQYGNRKQFEVEVPGMYDSRRGMVWAMFHMPFDAEYPEIDVIYATDEDGGELGEINV